MTEIEIECLNCTKKRNKKDDYYNCRLKCNYKYKKQKEWDKKEIAYLKECCIRAGKELSKHSFEWDGKEKNLVVQALYLNEKYEKLESALEEIREIINEQKPVLDKAISQSEFTFERLCNYEEKYTKIVDKINEALNDN